MKVTILSTFDIDKDKLQSNMFEPLPKYLSEEDSKSFMESVFLSIFRILVEVRYGGEPFVRHVSSTLQGKDKE